MSYSQQTWVDNSTPISAARLNNMETGIAAASAGLPVVEFAQAVQSGQLRVAAGTASSPFSAASYVYTNIDYTAAGFTQTPTFVAIAADSGVNHVYYAVGSQTKTGATAVGLTSGGASLTATVTFNWIAIGV